MNELAATVWLLQQGYEVFRNVSAHGDTDLVILKQGNLSRVDVKAATARRLADGSLHVYPYSGKAVAENVSILVAFPDGTFKWEVQDALDKP